MYAFVCVRVHTHARVYVLRLVVCKGVKDLANCIVFALGGCGSVGAQVEVIPVSP